jgi:hypothetical protein
MATPSIRIDLLIFIGEHWLKSAAMQVQLNDIAGGKRLLGQVREEQFIDHSFSCDPYGTLLFPAGCVATTTWQGTPSGPTGISGQS